jgi:hypothetical protein
MAATRITGVIYSLCARSVIIRKTIMRVRSYYNRKEVDHDRYLRNKVITHVCFTCKQSFSANRKRKYCSIECNPHIRKWDKSERVCETCNNVYKPRTRYQRWCKRSCQPYGNGGKAMFYQSKEWKKIRSTFIESYTNVNGINLSNKFCIECYRKQNRLNDMHAVDHIIRVKDGGSHEHSNLQSLCRYHHQSKSAVEGNRIRTNFGGRPKARHIPNMGG